MNENNDTNATIAVLTPVQISADINLKFSKLLTDLSTSKLLFTGRAKGNNDE